MATNVAADGPLRFPIGPPDTKTRVVMTGLKGHATSARWLPEGLFPELDEVRVEHLRVRARVAADLEKLNAVLSKHKREDDERATALRDAHRTGSPPVEDRRTPTEQRAAERAAIEESLWAGVTVLAEAVDHVKATIREHETAFLDDLRRRTAEAQEKRREAERLLAEARTVEWRTVQLGNWLQKTADDGAFFAQPAPRAGERMPAGVDPAVLVQRATERPWHKQRAVA